MSLQHLIECTMAEDKSVLDGVPVDNKAFPLREVYKGDKPYKNVVGACQVCGNPIYGSSVMLDDVPPEVFRTCPCVSSVFTRPPFGGTMETK